MKTDYYNLEFVRNNSFITINANNHESTYLATKKKKSRIHKFRSSKIHNDNILFIVKLN